jgi:Holliday junction resolvasome RuvABC endonuclease subunit
LANERIILGIDPGTIMGFGLIKIVKKKWNFAAQRIAIVQI